MNSPPTTHTYFKLKCFDEGPTGIIVLIGTIILAVLAILHFACNFTYMQTAEYTAILYPYKPI